MRWLATAGIAAPVVFTTLVVLQGALQPDYDHVALPISMLAAWPLGWVQNLNFYVYGTLLLVFFFGGLHRALQRAPHDWIGLVVLTICALGPIVAGIFPVGRAGGDFVISAGHEVGGFMHFSLAPVALAGLSRRIARTPEWKDLRPFVIGCAIVLLALFLVLGTLARPTDAALHRWLGLVQRGYLAVWFAALIVLALRLRRVSGLPAWW